MRTSKKKRTAFNCTKLAAMIDPADTRNGLYEIAKDNGLAMIDGERYGVGQYVFIPMDEWLRKRGECERDAAYGIPSHERLSAFVEYWHRNAERHRY